MASFGVLTEDHLWYVDVVLLMDLDRDTFAVIPHRDHACLLVYLNFYQVHRVISLEVVSSIHQNFIFRKQIEGNLSV